MKYKARCFDETYGRQNPKQTDRDYWRLFFFTPYSAGNKILLETIWEIHLANPLLLQGSRASVIIPVPHFFLWCITAESFLFPIGLKVIYQMFMDTVTFSELNCCRSSWSRCLLPRLPFPEDWTHNSGDSLQSSFTVIDIIIYIYYFVPKNRISDRSS